MIYCTWKISNLEIKNLTISLTGILVIKASIEITRFDNANTSITLNP